MANINNDKTKKNFDFITFKVIQNKIFIYILLIIVGITTLFPVIWMFYSSFKTNQEIMLNSFSLPKIINFENYLLAWNTAKMNLYFLNSIYVSIVSIFITILLGSSAAFILSKFKFKLQKLVYALFIIGMLIPIQSILVPLFIQMKSLKLLNTQLSLILLYSAFGLPITIFILESFIRSFPDSIMEAAIIDGSSITRVFFNIILPMSKPAIATVTILNFLNNWKEFSFALIFISDDSKKTLPLGLYNFIGAYTTKYAELMAAMVIASIPIVILYIVLQEQIINGMTEGAVKT